MKPEKHILDPSFQYRPSYETDIRRTFKRAMRRSRSVPARAPGVPTIVPLKKRA